MEKPLEFVIKRNEETYEFYMELFYANSKSKCIKLDIKSPEDLGFKLNRHYSISDLYGYEVIDDRKGL